MHFETLAIHAGQEPDPLTGAVVPPIYQTSTYKQDGVGGLRGGYEYSRSANPTRTALEECLAAIEGGRRGLAFASGLAAEDTLLRAVCRPGDHVVIPGDAYGGTYRLFAKVQERVGARRTRPSAGHDADAVRAAIRPGETKVVWVETPTNPLLGIADIAALAEVAHDAGRPAGRRQHLRLAVPAAAAGARRRRRRALDHQVHGRPLRRGRRRAGAGRRRAGRDRGLPPERDGRGGRARSTPGWCCAASRRSASGWTGTAPTPSGSPSCSTAHPKVSEVYYPGLPEHPGHEIAAKQMKAFGGMVSFRVAGGEEEAVEVCDRTEVFILGESLGGVESLIEHPGRMTHASRGRLAARGARPTWSGSRSASRPSTTWSRTSPARSPDVTTRRRVAGRGQVVCVDVGSTFTKAALVDLADGALLGTATHATTLGSDVMDGVDAVRAELGARRPRRRWPAPVPAAGSGSRSSATNGS